MNPALPLAEARRWLRYCEEDLLAAERMLAQGAPVPRHVCWLAQQSAEKALKSVLIALQVDFPRTHDLDALRNRIPGDWQVKASHPDLAALTEWAVGARYPGDWPEADLEDAHAAVLQARAVFESVTRDAAPLLTQSGG